MSELQGAFVVAGMVVLVLLLHISRTVDALSKQIGEMGEDLRKLTHPQLPDDF